LKLFLSDSEFDVLSENKDLIRKESDVTLSKDDIVFEDSSVLIINKNP